MRKNVGLLKYNINESQMFLQMQSLIYIIKDAKKNLALPHSLLLDIYVCCYMIYYESYDIVLYDMKQYCII